MDAGDLPPVLDACCGGRMFWYDPENPEALFMDRRVETSVLCDGRVFTVSPDVVADFRDMPFGDSVFDLVVFDPPHLLRGSGWQVTKYGKLEASTWRDDLRSGFSECWRVLRPGGTLVFKWSESHIKVSSISGLFPRPPLFGNRHGGTIWLVFYKSRD